MTGGQAASKLLPPLPLSFITEGTALANRVGAQGRRNAMEVILSQLAVLGLIGLLHQVLTDRRK